MGAGIGSGSPTTDSDRVKAPVVGAGPKDSGGGQLHACEVEQGTKIRGIDREIFIFNKRDKIGRSPTRPRADSLGGGLENLKHVKTDITSKRPREDDQENGLQEIKDLMKNLTAVSAGLIQCINVNINTKMEIKTGIKNVKWLVESINRRIDGIGIIPQKAKPKMEIKATNTIATQVNWEEIDKENERMNRENREEIIEALKHPGEFDTLANVIDKDWPEDIYNDTVVKGGNLNDLEQGEDVALFIDPQKKLKTANNADTILSRYPHVRTLMEESLVEGQMESVSVQTEITSKKGCMEQKYTLYALPINMDDSGIADVKTLYKNCKTLADEVKKLNKKVVNVLLPETLEIKYVRKCLEHTFRGSGSKAMVICSSKKQNTNKSLQTREKKMKGGAIDKIIVKAQGMSYAELLKSVKSKVDIVNEGIDVKKIKKTMKGDLLLEVVGNENASKLQNAIKTNMGNAELIHKTKEVVLQIFDIDADITKEQLEREIRKNVTGKIDTLQILSLRSTNWGSQTATIKLRKEIAEALARKEEIKIGWVRCKIKKKIHLVRCFKCLDYGHRTADCQGTDRSDICINCAKTGHVAKDCTNSSHCTTCRKDGHRADRMKCPHLRKLVAEEEKKRAGRRSTYRNRRYYSDDVFLDGPPKENKY